MFKKVLASALLSSFVFLNAQVLAYDYSNDIEHVQLTKNSKNSDFSVRLPKLMRLNIWEDGFQQKH